MSHQSRTHVPERLLRQLWKDQHFSAANLRTTDGREVDVLSPGISNHNGGPDFTDAQIRIGGHLYRGCIEIHRSEEEWKLHRHHQDTKYNRVILHVVLHAGHGGSYSSTESTRSVPVLALDEYLSPSWGTTQDQHAPDRTDDHGGTIRCFGVNVHADSSLIETWIEKLAVERFELKVRKFDERLREILRHNELQLYEPPSHYDEVPFGLHPEELPLPSTSLSAREVCTPALWDQILYEGVMEALGYSKNQHGFFPFLPSDPQSQIELFWIACASMGTFRRPC
ncbi:MAG TPA: DUF2851 family protein [Bacteroidota bacterium]|nr:DUF2851 family protein [Bacteroidota bacterium]